MSKLLNYIKLKKWPILFLIPVLFFFSVKITNAIKWQDFVPGLSSIANVPLLIIAFFYYVLAYISRFLSMLGGALLDNVIELGHNLSYTKNALITEGLKITLPMVNMILVLTLVFIALATILRIKEYEAKKLLPKLIIIALIINFSAVICGLAIDGANIMVNAFIGKNLKGDTITTQIWDSATKCTQESFLKKIGTNPLDITENNVPASIAACFALTIVLLILSIIYIIFGLIFMGRIIALWILVILSPIAFACAIVPLPSVRKLWDFWKQQFAAWAFIGITSMFFLYLAKEFSISADKIFNQNALNVAFMGFTGEFLKGIMTVTFFAIALYYSTKTSAMGANATLKLGKMVGSFALGGATKLGGAMIATQTGQGLLKSAAAQRNFGLSTLQSKAGNIKNPVARGAARVITGAGQYAAYLPSWATRKAAAAGIRQTAKTPQKIKEATKEFEGMDINTAVAMGPSIGGLDHKRQMAHVSYINKEFGGRGLKKLDPAYLRKVIRHFNSYAPSNVGNIAKSMPNLIYDPQIAPMIIKQMKLKGANSDQQLAEIIAQTKPDDLGKIDRSAFENGAQGSDIILKSLIHKKKTTNNQLKGFLEGQGQFGIERIEAILDDLKANQGVATRGLALKNISPNKYKYLISSAGAALGVQL